MFENIIGNSKIKTYIEASIEQEKVSHSYMFIGIEGIGKKLFAKEFAKRMLCLSNGNCENTCKSCIEFDSQNHPDFEIIEPDGNTLKIDQIRSMQKKIQEKPIISNKKIYIINDSDTMTKEAQNCLLKTLEEPPEFAIIILVGSNESLYLDTIKSRCIILHFDKIDNDSLKTYMENNYEIKNINNDILKIFQGSIGKAIELKDKIQDYEQIKMILNQLDKKDIIDIINMSKTIYDSKEEIYSVLEYINVMLLELSKTNYKYTKCIKIVENTKERLKNNGNYDMCIDNMLFSMWGEVN
ncbi:MAG: hypothetical protein J6I85_03900 [Clostridia bacterium]|nr:hypothetical protein [Clostridia bacterium]